MTTTRVIVTSITMLLLFLGMIALILWAPDKQAYMFWSVVAAILATVYLLVWCREMIRWGKEQTEEEAGYGKDPYRD